MMTTQSNLSAEQQSLGEQDRKQMTDVAQRLNLEIQALLLSRPDIQSLADLRSSVLATLGKLLDEETTVNQ